VIRDHFRREGPDVRSKANDLLHRLSYLNIPPPALALDGVNFHDRLPSYPGICSDVYRLEYKGEQVALKILNSFPGNRDRDESTEVGFFRFHFHTF
jgi:hypothetical protein